MPCYYPRSHLHSSWTSPCPPPLPRPGPPFLITIPLKWLFLSENDHVPCPLSLCLFGGLLSISLSPLPLLLPLITRAWASNWPQSPPPWVWATGARGQRKYTHIPPSFLDFLPMKCHTDCYWLKLAWLGTSDGQIRFITGLSSTKESEMMKTQ